MKRVKTVLVVFAMSIYRSVEPVASYFEGVRNDKSQNCAHCVRNVDLSICRLRCMVF
jgi:hypothetical protein